MDGDNLSAKFSLNHKGGQLPNPQLLVRHIARVQVAHKSGAAEVCDESKLSSSLTGRLLIYSTISYPPSRSFLMLPGVLSWFLVVRMLV